VEDVLRRMLTVDPHKRIEWHELFRHPVTRLIEDNLEQNLKVSCLCKKEELPFNLSKFYIKSNRVVENVHDIGAKKDLNAYVKDVIHSKEKPPYQGTYIRRLAERDNKENQKQLTSMPTEKDIKDEEPDLQTDHKLSEIASAERVRRNSRLVLHHRNLYAFLGHLAEDLIETHLNNYYQCLAFLLVKKVVTKIAALKLSLKKREIKEVQNWPEFEKTPEFRELTEFIDSEEDIFNRFYEKLSLKVFEEGTLSNFEEDLMISGKYTLEETNNRIYERVLREYLSRVVKDKAMKFQTAIQLLKLLDSLRA
jgi:hypothetical protein